MKKLSRYCSVCLLCSVTLDHKHVTVGNIGQSIVKPTPQTDVILGITIWTDSSGLPHNQHCEDYNAGIMAYHYAL